jgi:hypothetical protein
MSFLSLSPEREEEDVIWRRNSGTPSPLPLEQVGEELLEERNWILLCPAGSCGERWDKQGREPNAEIPKTPRPTPISEQRRYTRPEISTTPACAQ